MTKPREKTREELTAEIEEGIGTAASLRNSFVHQRDRDYELLDPTQRGSAGAGLR